MLVDNREQLPEEDESLFLKLHFLGRFRCQVLIFHVVSMSRSTTFLLVEEANFLKAVKFLLFPELRLHIIALK